MKIAFIGGGNMGEAMLSAVLEKKLSAPGDTAVADVSRERLEYLEKRYGVVVGQDNRVAVSGKDIVVLAVKPQSLLEVMTGLKGALAEQQLVISIIAGSRIATISRGLEHERIVRVMPNTPAQIGCGMSGWTATGAVTDEQKGQARDILAAMGKEIYFDDEKYLDMVTAVSASGPAYFFLMAEALADAAVKIGLSREDAAILVTQTMLGSARLLESSGKEASELRRNVTSKGGTTEKALEAFEAGGFAGLVARAVEAAFRRAGELGS